MANKAGKNFVKMEVGGQEVQVDGETGQIGKLTPEEARKLAAGFKQLVNKSGKGLDPVRHEDGSLSVDLEGQFQSVAVAKVNDDGTITQGCVDSPKAAAAFFGIDRALFETESPKVPKNVTPVNNQD